MSTDLAAARALAERDRDLTYQMGGKPSPLCALVLSLADELEAARAAIDAARKQLAAIVCTECCDAGVVLLSTDGPTHYDVESDCIVYDHEYFSPLGDALIALHKTLAQETSPDA